MNANAFSYFYWYGSSLHERGQKTEDVAAYDANCLLFTLDHVYGGKDIRPEIKNTKYGDYLKGNYPDVYADLYSTDPTTQMNAYDWIIYHDIGDGHTTPLESGTFYNPESHQMAVTPNQRAIDLVQIENVCRQNRQKALNLSSPSDLDEAYLEMKEDTAIIRFDQFAPGLIASGQAPEVYEANLKTDNFSLFYTAFRKIASNGGIKNIVIDISCNGGGAAMALFDIIGFVTESPLMETYEAPSESYFAAKYLTDCNADGKYEAGESPSNDYDMYVLTSGATFSCANIFAYYAKKGGAKIIGKQSGGGAYSPMESILPDGYGFALSSCIEFGRTPTEGENIDAGIPVDINLEYEDFYSIDAIRNAISSQ